MEQKGKLVIIAGEGKIPAIVAREAQKRGMEYYFISIAPDVEIPEKLKNFSKYIPATKFNHILKAVKKFAATEVIIIGKIPKKVLYTGKFADFDIKTLWLLRRLKNRNDSSIFNEIAAEFSKIDVTVVVQTKYLEELIDFSGILTQRKPTHSEMQDVEFGLAYAKEIARLDIGQTVIIKKKAVLAVEAFEGTDEAIVRAGSFTHGKEGVVCKVQKPLQDLRFDIPSVGLQTLKSMKRSGCSVLAIEEKKTFIVDAEEVIQFANENNISVISAKVSSALISDIIKDNDSS